MSTLSVNSVNSIYVRTSVAQQRVAADRANVIASETQLRQDEAQLDKDLTYLASLQRKTQDIQQMQGANAQNNALEKLDQIAQSAQSSSRQAAVALAIATAENQPVGSRVDIVA
jgi:hypothetical protein